MNCSYLADRQKLASPLPKTVAVWRRRPLIRSLYRFSTKPGGSGIGLSLALKLPWRRVAGLTWSSDSPAESVFTFILPVSGRLKVIGLNNCLQQAFDTVHVISPPMHIRTKAKQATNPSFLRQTVWCNPIRVCVTEVGGDTNQNRGDQQTKLR